MAGRRPPARRPERAPLTARPVTGGRFADDLELALRLADAADGLTAPAFTGERLAHELKPDGSPVSETDLAVERRISEIVAAERPGDGVLGEEVGESGDRSRRWVLDGIDGTVLFVAGVPGWSTQIALEVEGRAVVGVVTSGSDGRRWWAARGEGSWWRAGVAAPPRPLAVSDRPRLAGGRYSLIPPLAVLSPARRRSVAVLAADADYVVPQEHGALYVADGRVEACVQLGGGPWDFAGLQVVVEEAGGRFSDLGGAADLYGGGPALFSNGRVHDEVLAHLSS